MFASGVTAGNINGSAPLKASRAGKVSLSFSPKTGAAVLHLFH